MNQKTFDKIVRMFNEAKDEHNESLHINNLLIKKNDNMFHHHFKSKNSNSDIRSISKTVMTIILGVIIKQSENGKLPLINEETFIYPIIKDVIQLENSQNIAKLKKVQIKHLLTHTIGFEDVLLMRNDIKHMDPYEYVNYVVNYPIIHEPGNYYLYSNAGFYLLAVVLQEFLQEELLIFVKREVFKPLNIVNFDWEMYGNYIAGATRLWLQAEDLLCFGELLLHNGKVAGKQLISEKWINMMLTITNYTPLVDTPNRTFRRFAYGHGIWLPKDSFYFGHGTDGQTLTVIPRKETIIITLAEQTDIKPIERIIDHIITSELNDP